MSTVKELIAQLRKLQIDNARAERDLLDKIERLQERETKVKENTTAERDVNGRTIQVGDEVRILTAGIIRAKEGIVTELHKKQASVRTESGAHVRRAFHNLRITKKKQEE